MPISPTEFLKKYGFEEEEEESDHSLRGHAMAHAKNLRRPHAGTPHDWEEWERYKKEHPDEVQDEGETDKS